MSGEVPVQGDKIAERTAQLAAEVGQDAAYRARQFLEPHSGENGIITQDQLEAIADAEAQKAAAKFTAERNAGLQNDHRSVGRGLVAIVDQYVKDWYEERFPDTQLSFGAPVFYKIEATDTLYRLELPQGVFDYNERSTNIEFFSEATAVSDYHVSGNPDTWFRARDWSVVRIEGTSGELWQNPRHILAPPQDLEPSPPES